MTSTTDHRLVKGRTGRGISVAVVDSGINPWHPHVRGVDGGIGFTADGSEVADHTDGLGHGTAVAAAVRERAPDAALSAVRVFADRLATSGTALTAAFRWCVENKMRIINLSLGTSNPAHRERLEQAVDQATRAGCLVISVAPHGHDLWLPGALSGVVSVRPDETLARHEIVLCEHDEGSMFRASPVPRPMPGIPPQFNLSGPSFAVANLSGFLACLLERRPEIGNRVALRKTLLAEDA